MEEPNPDTVARLRSAVSWMVLAAVVLAYLPSLAGGWVWDDQDLLANPGILEPSNYLFGDAWVALMGGSSSLYRPLSFLSFYPGQALVGGPGIERVLSLAIHLFAVGALAGIGRALGASSVTAWLGAAVFGLHPGSTEAVAWLSARQWELPTALLLCAWWAQLREHDVAAGLLLFILPFFNEAFLVAPATAVSWMFVRGRFAGFALAGGLLGDLAYVVVRASLDLGLAAGPGSASEGLGALGGCLQRLLDVLVRPWTASPVARFSSHPSVGLAACTLALAGAFWLLKTSSSAASEDGRGEGPTLVPLLRSSVAALLCGLVLLAPPAIAASHNGIIGDRYLYPFIAVLGLVFALEVAEFARHSKRSWLLWLIPLGLAMAAGPRAQDWMSEDALFSVALENDPENPWAAFHRAHDLHTRLDDCEAALPLYALGATVDARSANNRVACLLRLGRFEEAADAGPEAALAAPGKAGPALNTARALLKLGRYEEAAQWATEAIPRDPSRAIGWELLGASRGQLGDYRAASEAFQKVVEIEPNRPGAQQQLGLALERFAAQAAPLPPAGQGTPDPSDDSTGDDASGTGKLQHGRQH